MANGAAQDYCCFVATTTGYFAVENSDGQLLVCRAGIPQVIPASQAIALWSCAGSSEPRPVGKVTALVRERPEGTGRDRGNPKRNRLRCRNNLGNASAAN